MKRNTRYNKNACNKIFFLISEEKYEEKSSKNLFSKGPKKIEILWCGKEK